MTASMLEYWATGNYGRSNLRLRSEVMLELGPGEALIKVAAISLNHHGLMRITDRMGALLAFDKIVVG